MPTLLEKGNILSPKGHDDEIPIDYIMNFFKLRIRGLGGETKKSTIMSDKVMILLANTGAGKSTTLPPEFYIRFKDTVHCKNKIIGCTQPTRLNAVEIPQDVVKLPPYAELKLGETIGYQTPFGVGQISGITHPQLVGDPLPRSQNNVNAKPSPLSKQVLTHFDWKTERECGG